MAFLFFNFSQSSSGGPRRRRRAPRRLRLRYEVLCATISSSVASPPPSPCAFGWSAMVSLTMLKVHVLGMARRIIPPLELFIVASGAVFSQLYHRAHRARTVCAPHIFFPLRLLSVRTCFRSGYC